MLYSVVYSYGGIPLLYLGDELALRNDPRWADDPAHAGDNRWLHRPPMDWEAAARRHDPASVEGRLWAGLRRLIAARRATRAIHVQGVTEPLWTGNDHVFGVCREQAGEALLVVANFTADPQPVALEVIRSRGFTLTGEVTEPDGRGLEAYHDFVVLAPYQHLWFYR
jgi:amylosucrase